VWGGVGWGPGGSGAPRDGRVPPWSHPEAAAGCVIMESCSYGGMWGTNTINTATVLLETGMLELSEPRTDLTLEAPAGLVKIVAECAGGRCGRITVAHVPSVATPLDAPV